ncbi:MAG: hypothetical protein QNJ97_16365 [Myxococcota bacterium]|nr:hypothetical protein [Myxococcota bacterium]
MLARGIFVGVLIGLLSHPLGVLAGGIVHVPSPLANDAGFTLETQDPAVQATASSPQRSQPPAYRAGGDGASAVVGGTALITALEGAAFYVISKKTDGPLMTAIAGGGCRLTVGSTPAVLDLGGVVLTAKSAQLSVIKGDIGYIVSLESQLNTGEAFLDVMMPPPPPKPAEPSQPLSPPKRAKKKPAKKLKPEVAAPTQPMPPPKPVKKRFTLALGQVVRVVQGSAPIPGAPEEQQRLGDLTLRLSQPQRTGPLLSPVDIEQASDLQAKTFDADEAFEDIEIEEIEVEAGCVEVCLD